MSYISRDAWAVPLECGGGTVESKQPERDKIARLTAEYEAKNGPVKTSPIECGEQSERRMMRALGDPNTIKVNKAGEGVPLRSALPMFQQKIHSLIHRGVGDPKVMVEKTKASPEKVRYALSQLAVRRLIAKDKAGNWFVPD